MLARNKDGRPGKIASVLVGGFAAVVLCGGAMAAKSSMKDQRISLEQAEKLTAVARQGTEFPIVVDELVLEQLNRYIGTPDGREYIREALARKKNFDEMITKKLDASRLPRELAAMPIVESKYTNLRQSTTSSQAAGIWQFIPQTARRYGLQVDDRRDERRNTAKLTDAAAAYLTDLHAKFKDWGLAIAAYNMGEGRVQGIIDETGIRDPWELARRQKLDKYLSAVMAAVIIMKNPNLID